MQRELSIEHTTAQSLKVLQGSWISEQLLLGMQPQGGSCPPGQPLCGRNHGCLQAEWCWLGSSCSLRHHPLLSPKCCQLREEWQGPGASSGSLLAVQHWNIAAGLGFVLSPPNTHFLAKGFFTAFTQNSFPAFQKQSPSSLLSEWIAMCLCEENNKSQFLWRSCLRDFVQNYHLQFY